MPRNRKKNKERKEKEVGRRESEKKNVKSFLCMPKLHINEYFASGSGGRKVYDLWTDLW